MNVKLISIILGGVLTSNFIFMQYIGLCAFIGLSEQLETAVGMSTAVIFVMTFASTVVAAVEQYILVPLSLEYLRTIAYIVVIAGWCNWSRCSSRRQPRASTRQWGSTCR